MTFRYCLAIACGGIALVADPSSAGAQASAAVTGVVVSSTSGYPLSGARVSATGADRSVTSDDNGRFRLPRVLVGPQTVRVERIGFTPSSVSVQVADTGATVRVTMTEAATIVAPVIVVATGEERLRTETSATIDVLSGEEVRQVRAAHPAGIMNRIAGVHVSELSGEGHSMAIRQPITTKPMYLFLEDGIPTRATGFFNHNALYEVNIPQSDGIEVLKGPGTALYGSDAIGGVVNVLTRPAPATPGIEATVEGGAHGYTRVLGTGGFSSARQGLRADLNVTRSDNWKDRAPFTRESATIRWDRYFLSGWSAKTVLTESRIDQQDVPPLTAARYFDGDRAFNAAPIAFRTVRAVRVSSAWEKSGARSQWTITPFARYNTLGLLPSWQIRFDPQTWDTRNTSLGLVAKYRLDFARWESRVIAGVDADWSPGSFLAKSAVTAPLGQGADRVWTEYTDGATHYDYDVTYRALSPYAHVEASPHRRLRVEAGLRYDATGYEYETRLAPADTGVHRVPASATRTYGHLSPKVGFTLNISPSGWLFGSYRHGFRAPSQGQLFQQNAAANTVDLRPVKVDSYEAGVRGFQGSSMSFQVTAYHMRIRDDILTQRLDRGEDLPSPSVASNAGETLHRGIEGTVSVAFTSQLRLDASYSVSKQRYVDWSPSVRPSDGAPTSSYNGNLVEVAPSHLGSALVGYSPTALRGGRVAVEWSETGGYWLEAGNNHVGAQPLRYSGHDLVNLHGNAFVRPHIELFARVMNVANVRYAEVASANPSSLQPEYTPGNPRTVYAGLRYNWSR